MRDVTFHNLEPATTYGALCALEQPVLRSYTAMSRTILAQLKSCWFNGNELKTSAPDLATSLASQRHVQN